jgi:hypothetical protein
MPTPAHFDAAKVYTSVHAGGTIAGLSEGARDAFRVRDRASAGDRRLMIGWARYSRTASPVTALARSANSPA